MVKNLHLEHPEDCILTGDLTVLDALLLPQHVSVKYDGAPAIVWGRNPETGNQFVGTKSVFNKFKIKINESHADIDNNHEGNVADILHHCFDNLPDTDDIIQGDFIGYGGDSAYNPNTICYVFDDDITVNIIVAPHTIYHSNSTLRDANAKPLLIRLEGSDYCKFIQPIACMGSLDDINDRISFAKQMAQLIEFPDNKEVIRLKKVLNDCIRQSIEIDPYDFEYENEFNIVSFWLLVKTIKEDILNLCYHRNGPNAYLPIDDELEQIDAEGYVIHNELGSYKLIKREVFSCANFNLSKMI